MRIALVAAAVFLLLLAAAVFHIAQPFTGAGPPWEGPPAEPGRLEWLVRELVSLGPRHDAAGQARAAGWIRAQLLALGHVPLVQFYRAGNADFKNLIVSLGPQTRERLAVRAHHVPGGPITRADDNANRPRRLLQ